jgi:hypothetical protein
MERTASTTWPPYPKSVPTDGMTAGRTKDIAGYRKGARSRDFLKVDLQIFCCAVLDGKDITYHSTVNALSKDFLFHRSSAVCMRSRTAPINASLLAN